MDVDENPYGTLQVFASTEATAPVITSLVTYEVYLIATGESTADYELSGLVEDTYYLFGIFLIERWIPAGGATPDAGDKLGEFSDGSWPGAPFNGTPGPLVYDGTTERTDITFTLDEERP